MSTRTSRRTVTFLQPFTLLNVDGEQPAGNYTVETDEELLQGVSFPAYRRVQTLLYLHAEPGRLGMTRTVVVDTEALDAALSRDATGATTPGTPLTMDGKLFVPGQPIKR